MFEKTVNFDNKNSWTDFKIIFKSFTLGAPTPQLVLINVPFRNGSLDETDYYGDITYNDRLLNMDFLIDWGEEDPYGLYSNVLNALNGQRKRIKISADQGWYYEGRLSVGDFTIDNGFWNFSISANVDPYKYKDCSLKKISEGLLTLTLDNDRMRTIPTITTTSEINVIHNDISYVFPEGTSYNPLLKLDPGSNTITIEGAAEITIDYRQGRL